MALPIHPEPELTELAKIYGEAPYGMLRGTRKSGFTPVEPIPPDGPRLDVKDWYQRKLIETAQKKRLLGFTAREVKAMGAFARFESPLPCNLQNIFHPVFIHWEASTDPLRRHNPILPLSKGRPGYWEMRNPLIIPVMTPVVRLASRFIEMAPLWSWWDTVAFGELQLIDKNLTPDHDEDFFRVIPRNPYVAHQERERVKKMFHDLSKVLRWGLTDGKIDPNHSLYCGSKWQGITMTDWVRSAPRCYLDVGRVEVLMRTDLPAGERFLLECSLAKTMVHELGHAWWQFRMPHAREPYFDDELTNELGYSLINAIFKGRDTHVKPVGSQLAASTLSYGDKERHLIAYQTPYPSVFDDNAHLPALGIVDSMKNTDWFPIPVEYFERIQQRDFWEYHVGTFGVASLYWGPLVHGRRVNSSYLPIPPDPQDEELIALDHLEGGTVQAAKIENRKRLNAAAIRRALIETVQAEGNEDEFQLDRLNANDPTNEVMQNLRARYILDPLHWANILGRAVPKAVEEAELILEPDRFLEVAEFLIRNKRVLAIDTMTGPMAESVFLGHINRLGQSTGEIQLTAEELREFLIYVDYQKIMLRWSPKGIGQVWRRSRGWGPKPPVNPDAPEDAPETPPPEHLKIMEKHLGDCLPLYNSHRLRDLDDELLHVLLNKQPNANLSNADYDRLITYLDFKKKYFIRGPPGIARCIMTEDEVEEIIEAKTRDWENAMEQLQRQITAAKERAAKLKRDREQMEEEDRKLSGAFTKKHASIMKRLEPSFIRASKADDKPSAPKKRKLDDSSAAAPSDDSKDSGLPPIGGLSVDDPDYKGDSKGKGIVGPLIKKRKFELDVNVETGDGVDGAEEEDILVDSP